MIGFLGLGRVFYTLHLIEGLFQVYLCMAICSIFLSVNLLLTIAIFCVLNIAGLC